MICKMSEKHVIVTLMTSGHKSFETYLISNDARSFLLSYYFLFPRALLQLYQQPKKGYELSSYVTCVIEK